MRLTVKRFKFFPNCTIGRLWKDGEDTGIFTLEDTYREIEGKEVEEWKVPGETAIPKGEYEAIIDFSNHFGRELPLLIHVPGYEGVRIHPGNTDADTEGCILVGDAWTGGIFIGSSRAAFEKVFAWIKGADKVVVEVG